MPGKTTMSRKGRQGKKSDLLIGTVYGYY